MADARTAKLNAARTKPGSHAGPHGSFPITDAKSVRAAVALRGHAANPGQVLANVKREAAAKGLSAALPESVTGKSKSKPKPPAVRRAYGIAHQRVGE